ncbi:MAG: hypothetical protein RL088_1349 [Verrucomicrobiota bacterium]|jgi:hypothetical protein
MHRLPLLLVFILTTMPLHSAEYFVAADGDNKNPGTLAAPFADISRAQELVKPGDTVFLRGGVYNVRADQMARRIRNYAAIFELGKSGTEDAPIRYWAYKDERPVLDFSDVKPPKLRVAAFWVGGSWLHLRGFEVTGVQVTLTGHTQSECFRSEGSNNIFEHLAMHDTQAIGLYLTNGSNNLILNCDAYKNWDYTSEGGRGGNSDGFGGHPAAGAKNNVFRGCRAWFNSDDGFDCISAHESIVFENCWAFYNGFSEGFVRRADGNGFKAGGHAGTPLQLLPKPIPRHTVRFCLAVRNRSAGFYGNHHIGGGDWFNNTAFNNPVNFNMLERLPDNVTDIPGIGQKMRNNLGFRGRTEITNLNSAKSDARSNSFDIAGLRVTERDFVSLDESQLTAPRKSDGSLPDISLMRLAPGSALIDAGEECGFPFKGRKPDLGAFEHGN